MWTKANTSVVPANLTFTSIITEKGIQGLGCEADPWEAANI